jgi:long-chain acyl-CoA synthetase
MSEHSVDPSRPWLRFYDAGVAHSIEIPPVTVPEFLRRSAEQHPNQIATVFLGARLTYLRLLEDANRFAHGLAGLGVKRGDRVAIMLPNCPQTIIAYYATLSLGAIAVMTNPLYTEPELVRQWNETGVEVAVALDRLWPRVRAVRAAVPLRQVIVTGIQDYLPFPKNLLFPIKARREHTWVDVPTGADTQSFRQVMRGQPVSDPGVTLHPDEVACLQYTGGTTGFPKGAMLTHGNLVATVMQIRQFLMPGSQEAEDRIVAILPIFHAYGMNAVMNLGVHLAATLILLPLPDLPMLMRAVRTSWVSRPCMPPSTTTPAWRNWT